MSEDKVASAEKTISPEDNAAGHFTNMYPVFLKQLDQLGGNQVKRVIKGIISFPLKDLPKFKDEKEEGAFAIALQLLSSNRIITDKVLKDKKEEELREQAKASKQLSESSGE